MQIANLKDIKLNWREDGNPQGQAVVFSNSLGTDLRLWDQIIPLLPQEPRYIRYDKRGHRLSSCPPAPYKIKVLVEDIEKLLDHLEINSCLFVGLSIGGMIGQGLASKRPDLIKALVLSNTATKFGDASIWEDRIAAIKTGGMESLSDAIIERWFATQFHQKPELEAWRNMLVRTPLEGYIGCCSAIAGTDLSYTTSRLSLPVLTIAGAEDGSSPPALVQSMTEMISGASMVTIKNAGHLTCVEKPEEFAQHLHGFMKENNFVQTI